MATDVRTCPSAIQTDADFRLWVQAIEGAMLATGGVVQDSGVTGQIDPTTVTKPATSTDAGYRIYRFNDAMHTGGTRPIWLKITYGIGSGGTNPRLLLQVGEASPTAGTFTGSRVLTSTTLQPNTPTIGNTRTIWASGGPGRVNLVAADLTLSGHAVQFHLERVKDLAGANVDDAVVLIYGQSTGSSGCLQHSRYAQISFAMDSSAHQGVMGFQTGQGTAQYGGDLLLAPVFIPICPNVRVLNGLCVSLAAGVLAAGSSVTFDLLGVSHTWMPLSANQQGGTGFIQATPPSQLLMLWE